MSYAPAHSPKPPFPSFPVKTTQIELNIGFCSTLIASRFLLTFLMKNQFFEPSRGDPFETFFCSHTNFLVFLWRGGSWPFFLGPGVGSLLLPSRTVGRSFPYGVEVGPSFSGLELALPSRGGCGPSGLGWPFLLRGGGEGQARPKRKGRTTSEERRNNKKSKKGRVMIIIVIRSELRTARQC